MAMNMPKPWIKESIIKCLDFDDGINEKSGKIVKKNENKITQIIQVIPELRLLIINDKSHKIAVALTRKCIQGMEQKGVQLLHLKNCFVSIRNWHVSYFPSPPS